MQFINWIVKKTKAIVFFRRPRVSYAPPYPHLRPALLPHGPRSSLAGQINNNSRVRTNIGSPRRRPIQYNSFDTQQQPPHPMSMEVSTPSSKMSSKIIGRRLDARIARNTIRVRIQAESAHFTAGTWLLRPDLHWQVLLIVFASIIIYDWHIDRHWQHIHNYYYTVGPRTVWDAQNNLSPPDCVWSVLILTNIISLFLSYRGVRPS